MAPAAKFKRALKSAARLPVRVAGRSNTGNNGFNPQPNEVPLVTLRIQVEGCANLMAKDKNGSSDPFVVVSVLNARQQTPVIKRNINPTYAAKDATFDFPIYASLADRLGAVELIVWDKDMLGKDYLGEVAIPLDSWFPEGKAFGFEDGANQSRAVDLVSGRSDTPVTGSVQVKIGFVSQPGSHASYEEVLGELIKRSRPSLVSVPPTEGVGTIRSTGRDGRPQLRLAFEDDGGLSSDEDDDDDTEAEDDDTIQPRETEHGPLSASPKEISYFPEERRGPAKLPPPPELNLQPASPINEGSTPTQGNTFASITPTTSNTSTAGAPTPVASPAAVAPPSPSVPQKSPGKKIFSIPIPRRLSGLTSSASSSPSLQAPSSPGPPAEALRDPVTGEVLPGTPGPLTPNSERTRKQKMGDKIRRSWGGGSAPGTPNLPDTPFDEGALSATEAGKRRKSKKGRAYSLNSENDILGIVMLEILKAEDLPKLKNMTRLGWDMDPFIVASFGKKVFRTRVIRHSLNPQWDEKLLFHVRKYETAFRVQLSVHDWDKMSSNDYIGDAAFEVRELIAKAPQKNPETGLYASEETGEHDMTEFKLPVEAKETSAEWESKHQPIVHVRAKYQPYELLRQKFWRQYLKQYDTDDTGKVSYIELTAMLDSLGSTLTKETMEGFWTIRGKNPHQDELSFDDLIIALEDALGKPDSERRRVDEGGTSTAPTPSNHAAAAAADQPLDLDNMDFSGPQHIPGSDTTEPNNMPIPQSSSSGSAYSSNYSSDDNDLDDYLLTPNNSSGAPTTPGSTPINPALDATPKKKSKFKRKIRRSKKEGSGGSSDGSDETVERVINVKNCPFCHRPRLNAKAEVDIITHLAVCASSDWNKVDQIMVGNFVTASQAQRKWYTKIIGKVSSGDYRLGANSANIIVQNRMTGQLEEEKMQVYVRLGIRLLYKGATSRMEGGRARRLLKSMSIKQGVKYDSPLSAEGILPFIQFHKLNMDEVLDPLDSFKTFNEFFYRKLKPEARPVEEVDNPYRLVSAADCRLMAFSTVDDATRLWIKGRDFTVRRLLGEVYKNEADRYIGGALVIFRLAPQDYHRFHSPVDGKIGPMTYITGEYYTVNPQAIRSSLDVYGENARKIVPIDSPYFGRVMAVCIGAMMVGSIKTTVQEDQEVKRGEEFGYFAFGGSTIVCLFEKGAVEWDEDLLVNGRASLETLVRVGMGIGTGRKSA